MSAVPGTLANYKHRDVPFAIWFDRERISWCLDVREIARVYPDAQGKIICNLPGPAQAVLIGKKIIEDIWRSSRMAPQLPAPKPVLALPAGPTVLALPSGLRSQFKGMLRGKLEAVHRAIRELSQKPHFTTKQLAQKLSMSVMQAGRVVRDLERRGYIRFVATRPSGLGQGRRGYFKLTAEGRRWVELEALPSVVQVMPQFERTMQAWREAIKMMGPVSEFTTTDLAQQLAAQRGTEVSDTTRRRAQQTIMRLQKFGYVVFVRHQVLSIGRGFVNVFALTPEGRQWLEATPNPLSRNSARAAAVAAIITGVGLLAVGIAARML